MKKKNILPLCDPGSRQQTRVPSRHPSQNHVPVGGALQWGHHRQDPPPESRQDERSRPPPSLGTAKTRPPPSLGTSDKLVHNAGTDVWISLCAIIALRCVHKFVYPVS